VTTPITPHHLTAILNVKHGRKVSISTRYNRRSATERLGARGSIASQELNSPDLPPPGEFIEDDKIGNIQTNERRRR